MSSDDKPKGMDKLRGLLGGGEAPKSADPLVDDRAWIAEQLEPVAGDKIICELGNPDIDRFVVMTMLEVEFEELQAMLRRRVHEAQLKAIEMTADLGEYQRRMMQHKLFKDASEAEEAWRSIIEYQYQFMAFWRDIRAEHDVWGDNLSVRQGFVVVSTGKKYQL